jgi:hypothetical protein
MAVHELKTWPSFFNAILRGEKTFECRKNDRDFGVNDTLILREFDPDSGEYTGARLAVRVTYLLSGREWGIMPSHIAMAISVVDGSYADKEGAQNPAKKQSPVFERHRVIIR